MSLNLDTTAWERRTLGDIARASKEKVDLTDGSVDRFIAGEHMETDDLKIHRWGDVSEVDLGPAFHRRFRPGQVLYGSRRTYLRKVAVADFDGVCANTTFVVETKDENLLLPEFLPFIMTSEPFHAFAIAESKGSVNPYVNWSDIERFELDLPPLDEQKRIADLLWAIERHSRSLTSLLDLEINSGRAAFSKLVQSVGSEARSLGDVGRFTRGRRFTKADYVGEGLGCVHYAQIHTDFVFSASAALTYVPESMKSSLRLARAGELIVAGTSEDLEGVGKAVAWFGDDVAVHDDCFIYSHGLDPKFASYLFASAEFNHEKRSFVSESKVVRLSSGSLAKMVLPIPDTAGQQEVVVAMGELKSAMGTVVSEKASATSLGRSFSVAIFGGN